MESGVQEVEDISYEDAIAEEKGEEAPTRPRPQISSEEDQQAKQERDEQIQQAKEDIDILAPKTGAKSWTFGPDDMQRTYVQRELSVIGSAQWFGLVGEILEEAMSGDHPLSLNSLLSAPTPRTGQLQVTDFRDADMFVYALGKLLRHSAAFVEKSVCIWLSVPDYEWELVFELMKMSPSQGGMSFDMFEEILATFIDQNYSEIDRFFRVRFPRLRDRSRARAKEAGQSRSSKR